jgi:hypothetical protein
MTEEPPSINFFLQINLDDPNYYVLPRAIDNDISNPDVLHSLFISIFQFSKLITEYDP